MIERLKRIAYIISKADKKAPIEDEANPGYTDEGAELSIGEDDAGAGVENLEEMFGPTKRKRPERIHYDMKNPEHRKMIREKLLEERKTREELENFRGSETEYNEDMAVAKYRKLQKELGENAEAKARGEREPYVESIIRKEMEELKAKFPSLEETIKNLDEFSAQFEGDDDLGPEFEENYDRSKDTAKNQQAIEEMEETLEEVGGREGANKRKEEEVGIDDVMVLAETMYNEQEAKESLKGLDLEDLREVVLNKFRKLNAVKASDNSNIKTAAEDEEEAGDLYSDLKSLKDEDKIGVANYVQLYALNKYFTKLLKKKEKAEAGESAREDEAVDIEQLERAIGKKPAPQHGQGKSIMKTLSPEQLKRYEQMAPASASMRLSVREAGEMCHKTELEVPKVTCDKCGDSEGACECPGGPTLTTVDKMESKNLAIDPLAKAKQAIENEDPICFDVAAEHGQMFGNVKHMRWFAEAVAEELG